MDFIWALITIGFLASLWLLINRQIGLTSIQAHAFRRAEIGLTFLAFWAGIKFIQNHPFLRANFSNGLGLPAEIISGIALMGGLFFAAVGAYMALWNIQRRRGKREIINELPRLLSTLSNLTGAQGLEAFVINAAREIATVFKPDFYFVERTSGNGKPELIHRCVDTNSSLEDETHKPAEKSKDLSADSDQNKNLMDYHKRLNLSFMDGGKNAFSIILLFRKINKADLLPERYQPLTCILEARLKALQKMELVLKMLKTQERQNELFAMADRAPDIASYLKQTFPIFADKIKCDYISIAVLDRAVQNMHRYSYVDTGGRLLENGLCYPLKQTITYKVALERKLHIANTLSSNFYRDDYHLYKSGFSSRLAYPLQNALGEIKGVLTLGAVRPRAFDSLCHEDLQFVDLPLSRLIEYHSVNRLMHALKKQVVSNFNLTFGLGQESAGDKFYDRSAQIVAETLPATMCRIWELDSHTNHLETLGLYDLHGEIDHQDRSRCRISLDLLPQHKTAITTGKSLIINQSNSENRLDGSELKALGLPNIKSAILVPMKLEKRILGIFSIGETRNWERRSFGSQELLYSQTISTIAALVHEIGAKSVNLDKYARRLKEIDSKSQLYDIYSELPSRLSSPISAILGAAQLAAQKLPVENRDLLRYNEIILRSADLAVNELRKFNEVKASLAVKGC